MSFQGAPFSRSLKRVEVGDEDLACRARQLLTGDDVALDGSSFRVVGSKPRSRSRIVMPGVLETCRRSGRPAGWRAC